MDSKTFILLLLASRGEDRNVVSKNVHFGGST